MDPPLDENLSSFLFYLAMVRRQQPMPIEPLVEKLLQHQKFQECFEFMRLCDWVCLAQVRKYYCEINRVLFDQRLRV